MLGLSDLSLRDMEYVLAVAEHLHISKAAQACSVSQPALSKQLGRIESVVGFPLFERTKRMVRVNPHAQSLIDHMRVVVDEASKLGSFAHQANGPLTGPFRLGVIATLGPYLLPHVLGPLQQKYPQCQLRVNEGHTDPLLEELHGGSLDAVLMALPLPNQAGIAARFTLQPFGFEPFVVAVAKRHDLAVRRRLTMDELPVSELLLLEEGNCLSDQTWALCPSQASKAGMEAFRTQATSITTLLHMVALNVGMTVIPKLATHQHPSLESLLRWIPFSDAQTGTIGRELVLVSRAQMPDKASVRALHAILKRECDYLL